MLATLIIVFRELLEAGLIVGIVMAATQGVPHRGKWIASGILAGVIGSCILALSADNINNAMEGVGQEIFNASVLLTAVAMLTWHNVWMASHGRAIAAAMKAVGSAVSIGERSILMLAVVVGIAILREGSEIVLFLYGIALSNGATPSSIALGGLIGLTMGIAVSALMYLGLLRIPTRQLFTVTSWLIALLAAGMAAQAVIYLQQAGYVMVLMDTAWDSSHILSNQSITGQTLHTLVGYIDRPNHLQLVVYVGTLGMIFGLMKVFKRV